MGHFTVVILIEISAVLSEEVAKEGDLWDSEIWLNSLSCCLWIKLYPECVTQCMCICAWLLFKFIILSNLYVSKFLACCVCESLCMCVSSCACFLLKFVALGLFVSRVHGVFCVLMFAWWFVRIARLCGCTMCVRPSLAASIMLWITSRQCFLKGSWVFVVPRSKTPAEDRLSIKTIESFYLFSIHLTPFAICRFHLSVFLACLC